ncbi:MAG: cytochrome c3 family protein [Planctomycetota bacterium]
MKKGLVIAGVLCGLSSALSASAEGASKLGDESDGSRAVSVHLIRLYDESKATVSAGDDRPQPFSTRQTCNVCHTYEKISGGRHFNYTDPNVPAGRAGQPWILAEGGIFTQLPLSYRSWPGTFRPEQIGLSAFRFVHLFGKHLPGGGAGELESDAPEEVMRQLISGPLEINCLACHNGDAGQDQAEYATQIALQNFRWAAAGACEFASVSGAAVKLPDTYDPLMSDKIKVTYREEAFDHKNRVLFDIVRKVPNERCYFCHSNFDLEGQEAEKWKADADVHLSAGLNCVDCHRNGLDHNIVRGYEGEDKVSKNPLAATTTCEGCHLGAERSASPEEGRLGAPRPRHLGIPPIHFEKMTCTACHSGLWPEAKARRTKTARAHALGGRNVNKSPDALPHIVTPVLARGVDGKIGPHKLFWPAFWGVLKGEDVTPINLESVREAVARMVVGETAGPSGDWLPITSRQIAKILTSLSSEGSADGVPVYISGGRLHRVGASGQLSAREHPAAKPCLWPIAHDVRPAAQSLGVRSCQDCHATDAPFFFADVEIDSPLAADRTSAKMIDFQDFKPFYVKAFAFSFVFRPWLKLVILASCAGLAGVLILYALRALACVVKILSEENASIERGDE